MGKKLQEFVITLESGLIVHDNDLKKCTLQAEKNIRNEDIRFKT